MLSNRLSNNGLGRKVNKDWKKIAREERKEILGGNGKKEYWQRCDNALWNYDGRKKTPEVTQAFRSYIGCQDKENRFRPKTIIKVEDFRRRKIFP